GGKIKLATSQANATAGTAIDLTGAGTGAAHKLTRVTPVKFTFSPGPGVDVDANTLFVSADAKLKTGDQVTYDNGGGTSIGGLTDDDRLTNLFVTAAGGGKVKLAPSLSNATAGTAIDLTSLGTGAAHKLVRVNPDEITFDPDAKRVELTLATDEAWVTG